MKVASRSMDSISGPAVSEIICLIKIRADGRQTDKQTEAGDLFLRTKRWSRKVAKT